MAFERFSPPSWRDTAAPVAVLVDLMLLLFMFLVANPFHGAEARLSMELLPPAPPSGPDAPGVTVWARLDPEQPGGVYYLVEDRREDRPEQLHQTIARATGGDPEVPVTILADPDVPFDWVTRALGECRRARARHVDFAPAAPMPAE